MVDTNNGCPVLCIGSFETATAKTTTAKLALKIYGDGAHFLDQKSSEESINSIKAATSTPLVLDDVESSAMEHRIVLANFNGATKTTIARGLEKPLGGLILNKNFRKEEEIPEKDENGRVYYHVLSKRINDDTEDAYDAEVEHSRAMQDPRSCRDFLAKMTKNFQKEPDEDCSNFQEKHKAACGQIGHLKPEYTQRKLKCYSLSLASYLLIEEAVENENDAATDELFVEVFKDRATFLKNVVDSLDRTDEVMENLVKKSSRKDKDVETLGRPSHEYNEILNKVLDMTENMTEIERTNYVRTFKMKGNKKPVVAVAHTKVKEINPKLSSMLKELLKDEQVKEKRGDIPMVTSGINSFSKPNALLQKGKSQNESKTSIEFPITHLSDVTKVRIQNFFNLQSLENDEDININENDDEIGRSQDYPALIQSTGKDTLKSCDLCHFTSRSKTEFEEHVKNEHPKCQMCKINLKDNEVLNDHMEYHKTNICAKCEKDVPFTELKKHEEIHAKYASFGQGLKKGKVGKKNGGKTNGWCVFLKENYNDEATKLKKDFTPGVEINHGDVSKSLAAKWSSMSKTQKKVCTDKAKEMNDMIEVNIDLEVDSRGIKRTIDLGECNNRETRMRPLVDHKDEYTCPFCHEKCSDTHNFKIHMIRKHQATEAINEEEFIKTIEIDEHEEDSNDDNKKEEEIIVEEVTNLMLEEATTGDDAEVEEGPTVDYAEVEEVVVEEGPSLEEATTVDDAAVEEDVVEDGPSLEEATTVDDAEMEQAIVKEGPSIEEAPEVDNAEVEEAYSLEDAPTEDNAEVEVADSGETGDIVRQETNDGAYIYHIKEEATDDSYHRITVGETLSVNDDLPTDPLDHENFQCAMEAD